MVREDPLLNFTTLPRVRIRLDGASGARAKPGNVLVPLPQGTSYLPLRSSSQGCDPPRVAIDDRLDC